MADFNVAWEKTADVEKGLSDNPADRGGITNLGISLRFLQSIGDADLDGFADGDINHDGIVNRDDVLAITDPDARKLAYRYFWTAMRCDELPDQLVAGKVFDLAVNMGPGTSALILQRALRACGKPVRQDGHLGPETLAAAMGAEPFALLVAIRSEAAAVYRMIVANDASQKVMLNGWLSRAYA